jgi:hypothetical protein
MSNEKKCLKTIWAFRNGRFFEQKNRKTKSKNAKKKDRICAYDKRRQIHKNEKKNKKETTVSLHVGYFLK